MTLELLAFAALLPLAQPSPGAETPNLRPKTAQEADEAPRPDSKFEPEVERETDPAPVPSGGLELAPPPAQPASMPETAAASSEMPLMPGAAPQEPGPSLLDERGEERDEEKVYVVRPQKTGRGLLIAAGSLWGFNVLYQTVDHLTCGGCAIGVFEHVVAATSIGLAVGGGLRGGATLAFDDALMERKPRNVRRARRVGLGLLVGGVVTTLVNDALVYRCLVEGEGPYQPWRDGVACNHGINRVVFDVGTGSIAAGAALLAGSGRYRRHSRAYRNARSVSVLPTVGRGRAGLSVGGRF